MAARLPFAPRTRLRIVQHDERGVRPVTRADCDDVVRPCPWIECRYHNARVERDDRALAPSEHGKFRGVRVSLLDDAARSCALDVAGRGAASVEEVAEIFGVEPNAIRLAEERALASLRRLLEALETED